MPKSFLSAVTQKPVSSTHCKLSVSKFSYSHSYSDTDLPAYFLSNSGTFAVDLQAELKALVVSGHVLSCSSVTDGVTGIVRLGNLGL